MKLFGRVVQRSRIVLSIRRNFLNNNCKNYKIYVFFVILYFSLSAILLFVIQNKQVSDAKVYHSLALQVANLKEFYPHYSNLLMGP